MADVSVSRKMAWVQKLMMVVSMRMAAKERRSRVIIQAARMRQVSMRCSTRSSMIWQRMNPLTKIALKMRMIVVMMRASSRSVEACSVNELAAALVKDG